MVTTAMSNFKEIRQYLVPQSSKNLKKTTHIKIFNYNFGKLKATDKDENGIVELALEGRIE